MIKKKLIISKNKIDKIIKKYCGGARSLGEKIKEKNFSCKIDSIYIISSRINQASV